MPFEKSDNIVDYQYPFQVNSAVQTDPEVVSDNAECEEETEEDMELNDEDEGDNSNDDEDPTWTPEEIDREYQKLKNEDDSEKTHDNPR